MATTITTNTTNVDPSAVTPDPNVNQEYYITTVLREREERKLKENKSFFPQFWLLFYVGKITGLWPFSFTIIDPKKSKQKSLKIEVEEEVGVGVTENGQKNPVENPNSPAARSTLVPHYYFSCFYPINTILITLISVIWSVANGGEKSDASKATEETIEMEYGIQANETVAAAGKKRLSEQVGFIITTFLVVYGVLFLRIYNLAKAKETQEFWRKLDVVVHEIFDVSKNGNQAEQKKYTRLLRSMKYKINFFVWLSILSGIGVLYISNTKYFIFSLFYIYPLGIALGIATIGFILCLETFIHCVYYLIVYAIVRTFSIAFRVLRIQIENLVEEQNQNLWTSEKHDLNIIERESEIPNRQVRQRKFRANGAKSRSFDLDVDRLSSENDISIKADDDDGTDDRVAEIVRLSSALSDSFEEFNETIRIPMLTFFLVLGIPMIFNLFLFFIQLWDDKPLQPVMPQLFSFVRSYIIFIWICNAGQEVTDVSLELADLLGKISIHRLKKATVHSLNFYHRRTLSNSLSICPGNYVIFDNEMITSLYGAFVTYMAILIQFNQPNAIDGDAD